MKFKVGDKVRCIRGSDVPGFHGMMFGDLGEIASISGGGQINFGDGLFHMYSRFELVEEDGQQDNKVYSVGDTVILFNGENRVITEVQNDLNLGYRYYYKSGLFFSEAINHVATDLLNKPTDHNSNFSGKRLVSSLGEKECIHCPTKEEAKEIYKFFKDDGTMNWFQSGFDSFDRYGSKTCFRRKGRGDKEYYESNGYTILPASDFLEDSFYEKQATIKQMESFAEQVKNMPARGEQGDTLYEVKDGVLRYRDEEGNESTFNLMDRVELKEISVMEDGSLEPGYKEKPKRFSRADYI